MSWIQEQEERDYDTQTEYLTIMRQEADDPAMFEVHCEEHDVVFRSDKEVCPECPPFVPGPIDFSWLGVLPEDEPPF
jgi:hypothetical protein